MIELPPPDARMVPQRKEAVVLAVRLRQISRDYALRRYELSDDELRIWERRYARFGRRGLATTKIQELR